GSFGLGERVRDTRAHLVERALVALGVLLAQHVGADALRGQGGGDAGGGDAVSHAASHHRNEPDILKWTPRSRLCRSAGVAPSRGRPQAVGGVHIKRSRTYPARGTSAFRWRPRRAARRCRSSAPP